MRYVYLYSWICLAYLFLFTNKIVLPVIRFLVQFLKLDKDEEARREKEFYMGFLRFPGGIIDWGAYGLLLIFNYILIGIAMVLLDLIDFFFEPQWRFAVLLVSVAMFLYYVIYFRSIKWLTPKIKKVSIKFSS
jgi:hypothetical protein